MRIEQFCIIARQNLKIVIGTSCARLQFPIRLSPDTAPLKSPDNCLIVLRERAKSIQAGMEHTKDSQLFALHEKDPKHAKIIYRAWRMPENKINVHGEFTRSVLPSSPYTPIDLNFGPSLASTVNTRPKPKKCIGLRSSPSMEWNGRKNHLTQRSL
jgi:hypothetical protein